MCMSGISVRDVFVGFDKLACSSTDFLVVCISYAYKDALYHSCSKRADDFSGFEVLWKKVFLFNNQLELRFDTSNSEFAMH